MKDGIWHFRHLLVILAILRDSSTPGRLSPYARAKRITQKVTKVRKSDVKVVIKAGREGCLTPLILGKSGPELGPEVVPGQNP